MTSRRRRWRPPRPTSTTADNDDGASGQRRRRGERGAARRLNRRARRVEQEQEQEQDGATSRSGARRRALPSKMPRVPGERKFVANLFGGIVIICEITNASYRRRRSQTTRRRRSASTIGIRGWRRGPSLYREVPSHRVGSRSRCVERDPERAVRCNGIRLARFLVQERHDGRALCDCGHLGDGV